MDKQNPIDLKRVLSLRNPVNHIDNLMVFKMIRELNNHYTNQLKVVPKTPQI